MKNEIQPAGQVKTEARGIGTVTLPNRIFGLTFAAIIATAFVLAFFVASAQAQQTDVSIIDEQDPTMPHTRQVEGLVRGVQGEVVEANGIENNELVDEGEDTDIFEDSTHAADNNSYCDITMGTTSGDNQDIDLPDCTDGSIYVTNKGSGLTTDPEVERRGDRADEEDWQLGAGRDYVGDNNNLFASVIVLSMEVDALDEGEADNRRRYRASNYVIRDYDRVIVTVIDEDRNSTTDDATVIARDASGNLVDILPDVGGQNIGGQGVIINDPINLTRPPFSVDPLFVSDENDNDDVDRGDFNFDRIDIDGDGDTETWIAYGSDGLVLDRTRGTPQRDDDINIGFSIDLSSDDSGNPFVFVRFRCDQGCVGSGGTDTVHSVVTALSWERARFNSLIVVVDSDSGGEEFDFTLWESGPDTGIFEGQLKLIHNTGTDEPTTGPDDPELRGLASRRTLEGTRSSTRTSAVTFDTIENLNSKRPDDADPFVDEVYVIVSDGDSVSITYEDQVAEDGDTGGAISEIDPDIETREAIFHVDSTPPEVEITVPVDNDDATDNDNPTFEGTFSDDNSGLSENEIAFVLNEIGGTDRSNALLQSPILSRFDTGRDRERWIGDLGSTGSYPEGVNYPPETRRCTDSAPCIKKGDEDIVDDDDFPDFEDGDRDVGFRITDDTYDNVSYEGYLNFQAYGVDLAGNVGLSDADDSQEETGLPDPEQIANPHSILIDSMEILERNIESTGLRDAFPQGALTGRGWDPRNLEVETNVRDSVLLIFPERLDNSTVDPSDFRYDSSMRGVDLEVVGVTTIEPEDVEDEDFLGLREQEQAAMDEGQTQDQISALRSRVTGQNQDIEEIVIRYVFLELNGEIPAADEPTIEIVGDINDRAGNRLDDDIEIEVDDGLPPQVQSVTLSEGSGLGDKVNELTNDDITIQIQVNEDISASNITVQFWQDEHPENRLTSERVVMLSSTDAHPRKVRGEGMYELDYSVRGRLRADDVYVVVIAQDNRRNRSIFGAEDTRDDMGNLVVDPTQDIDRHGDKTVFEFDNEDPALDNDDDGDIVDPPEGDDPDSDDVSSSDVRKNLVIIFHEEVYQVNEAEIEIAGGGTMNILNDLQSSDNEVWVFTPTEDWPLGEHMVRVVATDLADNESGDLDFTFEISEREDFNLSLRSGWNAVSLPSDPVSGDIGSVFTNDGITQVIAYEPWSRNPWRNATRSGGSWVGSLDQIRGGVGYWVFSESFQDQDVTLVSASEASVVNVTPPTIRTFRGWNLVGALDPTRREAIIEGETGDMLQTSGGADYCLRDYLSSAGDVARAYEFDTIESTFDRIDVSTDACRTDDEDERAQAGKAYWIFIDDDIANPIAP